MQNKQLFKQLAELLGYSEGYLDRCPTCIPNYMDWSVLMPIAVEHEVGFQHEGTINMHWESFCFKRLNENVSEFAGFYSDKTPQLAIVKCLIAKLESENDSPQN